MNGARRAIPLSIANRCWCLANYVTLDAGTGCVHTAPGHGYDDYVTGVNYGLDIFCPVDDDGRFLNNVEQFRRDAGF